MASKFRVLACLNTAYPGRIRWPGARVHTSTFDELGLRRARRGGSSHQPGGSVPANRLFPTLAARGDTLRVLACHCSAQTNWTGLGVASGLSVAGSTASMRMPSRWPEFPVSTAWRPAQPRNLGIMASCEGDVWGVVPCIQRDRRAGPMFADFIAIDAAKNAGTFCTGFGRQLPGGGFHEIRLCKHSTVEGGGRRA